MVVVLGGDPAERAGVTGGQIGADRSRLADELDNSLVKTRKLERTNREIAEKLDAAIGTIRSVLDAGEGP